MACAYGKERNILVRLCHLIDHTDAGGAQRIVTDLVETRADDIEPTVITLRRSRSAYIDDRLRASGATVRSLDLKRWDPLGLFRLRAALAAGSFEVVHAHLNYSNSSGIAAALALGAGRPRVVSHLHNDSQNHNGWIFRTVTRSLASRVEAHVGPSRSVVETLQSSLAGRMQRIACIENGIDLDTYRRDRHDPALGRALRGGATRVIGFVGRMARQKRIDSLLRVTPALLRAEPSTRILLIGDGPSEATLRAETRRLGIEHAVHFAGHLDDVVPAYLAMDVLVLPSDFEGFGLVLAEAMAMEVPVVATRVIGIVDVVEHGTTGLLTEPGDLDGLTSSILSIFADPGRTRSLVDAANLRVRQGFSRVTMTRRFEDLYRELVSTREG